jgi:hypothetical protein
MAAISKKAYVELYVNFACFYGSKGEGSSVLARSSRSNYQLVGALSFC